jgi:hypothetical protein
MPAKVVAAIERMAEQGELAADLLGKLGPPKATVVKNVVTSSREIALSQLPGLDAARKWLLDRGRTR